MASVRHEGLVALFRNRPTLAPELLRDVLGLELPRYSEARIESSDLSQALPAESRADLVVLLLHGKPVLAVVLEVQLSRDPDKKYSWPVYLSSLRARLRCPTELLVVAPHKAVARWCAQPIAVGSSGFTLRPWVLGPEAIPVVTDERLAREDPELAVLSVIAHGKSQAGPAIAQVVLKATRQLEGERAMLYLELTQRSLSQAARSAFEALMQNLTFKTELARKYFTGVKHARKEGKEEGKEEGKQEGKQEAVLAVLAGRGLRVDAQARQRILSCTNPAQLDLWLHKVAAVGSVRELLEHVPAPRPASRKAAAAGRGARKPRSQQ
jgi:hypothetical protein